MLGREARQTGDDFANSDRPRQRDPATCRAGCLGILASSRSPRICRAPTPEFALE
jgi:hypothetical protein